MKVMVENRSLLYKTSMKFGGIRLFVLLPEHPQPARVFKNPFSLPDKFNHLGHVTHEIPHELALRGGKRKRRSRAY